MWKKIHSNRDPQDTLYSELRKEFRPWFESLSKWFSGAVSRKPRFFFCTMVLLLLVSAALSFTVFRHPDKVAVTTDHPKPQVMKDGFSRIMQAAGQLKVTLELKATVDSLTAKRQLTGADSLLLDSALSRLQRIHQPSN